jgi:hypothetical protein
VLGFFADDFSQTDRTPAEIQAGSIGGASILSLAAGGFAGAAKKIGGLISDFKALGKFSDVDIPDGPSASVNFRALSETSRKPKLKVVDNALPNATEVIIDPQKLIGYSLNPTHPVGKNKAIVFESALGYNLSNADDLIAKIRIGVTQNVAVPKQLDKFGQRYTVDIPITGPNGKTVPVRTGFIVDTGATTPRLVSAFINN